MKWQKNILHKMGKKIARILVFILLIWIHSAFATSEKADSSLTWAKCVEIAFKNNTDFLLAQNELKNVEGRILKLKAPFRPRVGARAVSMPMIITIQATQVFYSASTVPTMKAAQIANKAAYINAEQAAVELAFKLRIAFDRVLYLQKQIPLYEKYDNALQLYLKRSKGLFDGGMLTKASLQSLEVREIFARENLQQTQLQFKAALLELANVLGIDPSDPNFSQQVEGEFDRSTYSTNKIEDWIAFAFEQRRDLKALHEFKLINEQLVIVLRGALIPTVSFFQTFSTRFESPSELKKIQKIFSESEQHSSTQEQIGLLTSWRVFDGNKTKGQMVEQKALSRRQDIFIKQLENSIPGQITALYSILEELERTLYHLEKSAISQKNIEQAIISFETGKASSLELVNAQQEDLRYELNKLQILYQMDLIHAGFDKAIGNLVSSVP